MRNFLRTTVQLLAHFSIFFSADLSQHPQGKPSQTLVRKARKKVGMLLDGQWLLLR
jgi:hypothetical protein